MTVAIADSSYAWIDTLSNSYMIVDMNAAVADGVFSYDEMLDLLSDVAGQGTVTTSAFGDLQAIAANLNIGVSVSSCLASIFTQLVCGSPANASWTGGADGSTALGDLGVGSSSDQLTKLIGKWFLGTDLPDPTLSGGGYVTYETFTLPLYGDSGLPTKSDVAQGALGDCVVCAALLEMANTDASALQSNIVSFGNGVYCVRFYIDGNETWVTVNSDLPVSSNGSLAYMNAYNGNEPPLWADLMEKAYAQLSSTGQIGHPAVNAYENIDGNYGVTVAYALTGANIITYRYNDANWSYAEAGIIAAINAGQLVLFSSEINTTDNAGKTNLVGNHELALVGYNVETGNFIARNPWGYDGTWQYWNAEFEVSMTDLVAASADVCIANTLDTPIRIVTAQGPHECGQGWYYSLVDGGSTYAQYVDTGAAVDIASLFDTINATGTDIAEYLIMNLGGGTVQLNGAVNLASTGQQADGMILVSAEDMNKLTYYTPVTSGYADLLVSAFDGTYWSAPTDVALRVVDNSVAAIVPTINAIVAQAGSVAISDLFTVMGSPSVTYYQISANEGTINTNGAYSWGSGSTVDIYANDLDVLTYTAPTDGGYVTLRVWVYTSGGWSTSQTVQVLVGESAADAIQDYDNGRLLDAAAVADSAANIFANLDGLQAMVSAGVLEAVLLTDQGTVTHKLTVAERNRNMGVLSILSGDYVLVTATSPSDFDGDGNSDILWVSTAGQVAAWTMEGARMISSALVATPGSQWSVAGIGDVDGDGKVDIVWKSTTGDVAIWEMNGTGMKASSFVATPGTEWSAVGTGDFDADGKADILWLSDTGSVAIWEMNGMAMKASGFVATPGMEWSAVGTGDFDGDGKADILWKSITGDVAIWEMNGMAMKASSFVATPGGQWSVAGTGDFDGDAKADILWVSTSGDVAIWEMNGMDMKASAFVAKPGTQWSVIGTADYDGDGKSDILWHDSTSGQYAVWMMNGMSMASSAFLPSCPDAAWNAVA